MKRCARAAVFVLVLVLAGPAWAEDGEPVSDPLVVASVEIARTWWTDSAPGWTSREVRDRGCVHAIAHSPLPYASYPGQSAAAEVGSCHIWIDPAIFGGSAYTRGQWCQVIVHEFGHLLGWGHDAPYPVMQDPWQPGLVPACAALDAAPLVKRRSFTPPRVRRGRRTAWRAQRAMAWAWIHPRGSRGYVHGR